MQEGIDIEKAVQSREEKFRTKLRDDRQRIAKLKAIRAEYDDLERTLQLITTKIKHRVMVPVGPKAFFNGYLTSTNQVTVAIGDNYFIKCSASHAKGIIKRRKELIDGNIKKFEDEFAFLLKQLGLAAEVLDVQEKDVIEIREEYHSDEDEIEELNLPAVTQPANAEKKPIIEVLSSVDNESVENDLTKDMKIVENEDVEDDPVMKLLNHYAALEMEEEMEEKRKEGMLQPVVEKDQISTIIEIGPIIETDEISTMKQQLDSTSNSTMTEPKKISRFKQQMLSKKQH